ncbi:class I adenylate-forming enzyme family protein [Enterovirga aerilata]|nr:class I adenylate-forming enzyme family protein [Enterovirga sp. DB1703]
MEAVRRYPDREALVCGSTRMTWRDVEYRSAALARGLLARGLGHGTRIALLLGNCVEFPLALLAAARIGAIVVPINIREQSPGVARAVRSSGASVIVHEAGLADLVPNDTDAPSLKWRVSREPVESSIAFADFVDEGDGPDIVEVNEEDTLLILYTSGTTGTPKGVEFPHLGVVHSAMHSAICAGLTCEDRSVIAIPLSFTGGVISAFSPLVRCAGTAILLPDFKAAAFLATAAEERMTHTLMVPTMYELCLRQPDSERLDLSQWRMGVFGAAPMPLATINRLAERWPTLRLANSYGATEAGGPAVFMRSEETVAHSDSVGRAFTCVSIAVMDESGRELPRGETGEIWIAGPTVASRFWNDPEGTSREYRGGWWRSGDMATMDPDGRIRLVDRKKDMINRGGLKISSTQVEDAIHEHPAVIECAVVGRPDEVLGERAHAFVRSNEPGFTAESLKEFLRPKLADYKLPDVIEVTREPLPRNVNGKILKRELRATLAYSQAKTM